MNGLDFCEIWTEVLDLYEIRDLNFNLNLSGNYLIKCKQMITLWD